MKHLASLAAASFAAAAFVVAACESDRLVSPAADAAAAPGADRLAFQDGNGGSGLPSPAAPGLRVMTYNLYLGTDFKPVFTAEGDQALATALYMTYLELQQTNFPERAGRIAAQIAKVRPDLLGIEEVARWSASANYTYGTAPTDPFVVQYDFLQLLLDSLAARGLAYTAPAVDVTSDVTAPVFTGVNDQGVPTGVLVNFQDRDAVLVRSGVRYTHPRHGVYQAAVPLSLNGQTIYIRNGWSSVRASTGGRTFRFVATHLNAEAAEVNDGQAQELVGLLQSERDAVVLAGDFNSGPGVTGAFAGTYGLITRAGFVDLWPIARPRDPGLTNGPRDGVGALNDAGVLIPYASLQFTARVDLLFVRDGRRAPHPVHAATFGYLPSDRTATGLWPSDHAAVGMVFELPELLARH